MWLTKTSKLLLMSSLFFLTGCHVSSKTAMDGSGGRTAYNEVLQRTNSEQMLLNLVRLRYFDSPFFLNVANITTQFTYKASALPSIPIPGFTSSNPFQLGGDFTWQNQPTIQYTPLEGQQFAQQLLHPIDLRTLQQLILSGWNVDLVFRVIVQSFDTFLNAPEASGPVPEHLPKYNAFYEVTKLLRYFQKRSQLQVGIKMCPKHSENGINGQILQIAFPKDDKKSKQLADLLSDVHTVGDYYVINLQLGFTKSGKVGIMTRSLLSCMYYLSNGIEIPDEDVAKGYVVVTRNYDGETFGWDSIVGDLIHIRSSYSKPKDHYMSVRYRNKWFYIGDDNLPSKTTFLLLQQLYNLQSQASNLPAPLLTLPLGG
jgi:hypothetical protein